MAEDLSELCTLLVEEFYGNLSSVFCTLMQHGRLHLRSLLELSGLSRRHLKNGLAVLIQQHLTLHSTEEGVTYYQANWPQAYDLVRSGKIIKHVENRFGENAAGIISNLLLYGHAEVGELAAAYDFSGNNRKSVHSLSGEVGSEGQVNGNHASAKPQQEIRSLSQLHNLLSPLLAANYITTVNSKHFLPQADIHNRAEDMVKRTSYEDGVKGKKLQAEFKNKVKNLKRKWRDDPDDHVQTNGESNAKNSSSSHAKGRPRKRVRLNGALVNGALYNGVGGEHSDDDDDETAYLASSLVVRANYEKLKVALRSQQLVDLAGRHIGETPAKVYGAFLRVVERKTPRCYDELAGGDDEDDSDTTKSRRATTLDVASMLDPAVDLNDGISSDDTAVNGSYESADLEDDELEGLPDTAEQNRKQSHQRLSQIERHLKQLADDPRQFISWVGSRGRGEWEINFNALTETLIQFELECTIKARFGNLAARVVRILQSKGKLDEKVIADFALIRQKDVRATLTTLQEAGLVETQEVPRDQIRQSTRAMYLWFFDRDHCRRLLLVETYKSMARLLQRARVECAKVQAVIDKAERTDVVGNEDQYLSVTERQVLRGWREREEKLLTQLMRQDDLVATLRDFSYHSRQVE